MEKSVYYINTRNGRRGDKEIIEDLKKSTAIVFDGEGETKETRNQERLVRKMHRPIWYRPKTGFLDGRF
ncbi:MAG: hypothetical protein U9Q16_02070 [Patescibacteria group bacterium]|nr:hypothetical protein [Patescibacteria group bacterium]